MLFKGIVVERESAKHEGYGRFGLLSTSKSTGRAT